MSISVTGNASSVSDVLVLLSNLGFDTSTTDAVSEIAIDRFDHWQNRTDACAAGCTTLVDFVAKAA